MTKPRQTELEAYLDEALPPDEMARIEHALRRHPECVEQLAAINARRDAGVHTLGEIWRRHRLSCPSRDQLGSYLLGALPDEPADHVAFHVEVMGCRWCQASLDDLRRKEAESPEIVQTRRRKYFASSAGYL
ncbi:MAG TPA: hypothetical protein VJL29_02935 [Thermoguttaceae bacterium]|nr:hypothetical protein [Thermoguttaceae bacterium]